MSKEGPTPFRVTWTGNALDMLGALIEGTKHGEGNPAWVERKFEECVLEGIRRLELFPDRRIRYIVAGLKCNGMTLHALPVQVFFRQVALDEIAIFDCRWATLDRTGPGEIDSK